MAVYECMVWCCGVCFLFEGECVSHGEHILRLRELALVAVRVRRNICIVRCQSLELAPLNFAIKCALRHCACAREA